MLTLMFESNKTAEMIEFIESTKKNLLKFVPFSLFIVIPFAEFALPFYLYFFPNAFPTSFIFDDQYFFPKFLLRLAKQYLKKDRKQMNAQRQLFQLIKSRIPALENIKDAKEFTPEVIQQMTLDYQKELNVYLNYKDMNSEQLVLVKILFLKYRAVKISRDGICTWHLHCYENTEAHLQLSDLPGKYLQLGNKSRSEKRFTRINLKQNFNKPLIFPLEELKRKLLLIQIDQHIAKSEREDDAIRSQGYSDMSVDTFKSLARQRGMPGCIGQGRKFEENIGAFQKDWIDFTQQKQVFDNGRIWYAILHYERFHSIIVKDYNKRVNELIIK